jgi:hypothetical protein
VPIPRWRAAPCAALCIGLDTLVHLCLTFGAGQPNLSCLSCHGSATCRQGACEIGRVPFRSPTKDSLSSSGPFVHLSRGCLRLGTWSQQIKSDRNVQPRPPEPYRQMEDYRVHCIFDRKKKKTSKKSRYSAKEYRIRVGNTTFIGWCSQVMAWPTIDPHSVLSWYGMRKRTAILKPKRAIRPRHESRTGASQFQTSLIHCAISTFLLLAFENQGWTSMSRGMGRASGSLVSL